MFSYWIFSIPPFCDFVVVYEIAVVVSCYLKSSTHLMAQGMFFYSAVSGG